MSAWLRQEIAYRMYGAGCALVNRANRLDSTVPTELRPSLETLAYGLDAMGLRLSEVAALAEERADASGRTLGQVMTRPSVERLLPL